MTEKEQLLLFIDLNINETNRLKMEENVVYIGDESGLVKTNDPGWKTFTTPKENLIKLITENYTDTLYGKLPHETMIVKILSWHTIGRPEE